MDKVGCSMIKISKRLTTIAEHIESGSRVADIGSDHALLPVYLVQSGIAVKVVAGEVNAGPLRAAKRQVESAGLASCIDVRSGNGLQVIAPYEADTVTIAGMGGSLIRDILEAGREQLSGVKRLVLQPNVGEDSVRYWLADNGWFLSAERIVEEDGLTYEILIADRVDNAEEKNRVLYEQRTIAGRSLSTAVLFRLGPYLIQESSDIYLAKWRSELAKRKSIVKQIAQASSPEAQARMQKLQQEINELEEALSC